MNRTYNNLNHSFTHNFTHTFKRRLPKLAVFLTFCLALITLPLYALKISQKQGYTDFDVYYRAVERVKNLAWDQVYNLKDGASPFRYAPLFIPFFRPFAEFTLPHARLVWFFLQYFWFGLGFYWIYRSLRLCLNSRNPKEALTISCLALLFIFRFCLDTFTIGQVSSLMFLGFCGSLYAWLQRSPILAAAGLLVPTLFKIGPGFLFGVFAASRPPEKKRVAKSALTLTLVITAFSSLTLGSWDLNRKLWLDWSTIVANDSVYYDASHYGSQSLKSVLLRWAQRGWITLSTAHQSYAIFSVLICLGVALFWLLRRPRTLYGRGLFFCLGLFVYLWVMPETFKYSLTSLAIPVAFLFAASPKSIFNRFALIFGIITLSLGGKDLVSDSWFFDSQIYSIPFLATVFLAIEIFRLAWQNSSPSSTGRWISDAWNSSNQSPGPWASPPHAIRSHEVSLLIPIPLQKSSAINLDLLEKFVQDFHALLRTESGSRFEILFIIYGDCFSQLNPIYQYLKKVSEKLDSIQLLIHPEVRGRGSALRAGFLASKGKRIFTSQIQQPCDARFFKEALHLLNSGFDLVRANRRLSESQFQIPVRLLPLVYGRHRLGLLFNRLVRATLPIQTTDTHSGTWAMSWRLAIAAFSVQTSPDFLFDIELNLSALGHGYREKDLPVSLSLGKEKSFQQMILETFSILRGLPVLAWRFRNGCYGPLPTPTGITADDWGLSPEINRSILELAQLGVIRRVSIMAQGAYLQEGLKELCSLKNIDLGLHFNLTYGKPSPQNHHVDSRLLENTGHLKGCFISSPQKFMLRWLGLRSLAKSQVKNQAKNHVRTELQCQLKKLQSTGIQIRYLDGHHHIHLVPGLIDSIADLIQNAGIHQIRLPYDLSLWRTAQFPLIFLSLWARSKLIFYGFQSLPCIYPQHPVFQDQGLLRALLIKNPHSEVIVHPARKNDLDQLEFPDSYTEGRVIEYRALKMLSTDR